MVISRTEIIFKTYSSCHSIEYTKSQKIALTPEHWKKKEYVDSCDSYIRIPKLFISNGDT